MYLFYYDRMYNVALKVY